MKRRYGFGVVIAMALGVGLGCGGGERAVVPTGPIEAPKKAPTTLPMIGPKLPQSKGK